ncbi:hypothetical protein MNV49_006709 [Pseudohyphozyma bogoriensis]|nr:hypothetical protein MNV49_006709 [Pseudohyphozyma bogoriensis]
MGHGHDHVHSGACGCEDDDHLVAEGDLQSLFSHIDRDRVVGLNTESDPKVVIRPWDERSQEDEFVESDADEQLILHIPFTGSIKLRALVIKSGPVGHTPDKVKIFVNQTLDFDEAGSTEATQTIDIPVSREAVEYALRPAKFPAVQHLTLFFPSNNGEDTSRISFVGFKGEYSPLTRDPIITVYEAQANPADHAKIKGLEHGAHSQIG